MTGIDAAPRLGDRVGDMVLPASPRPEAGRHRARRIEQARRRCESAEQAEATETLNRARHGDEASFTVLYRTIQPRLLRYLTVLVGSEAEDVAAEAWLQICRDLPRFRGGMDDFRGWTATIARHRALDHLRASRRRPTVSPDEGVTGTTPREATAAAPEDLVFESLSTARALAAIRALPKEQAEAVLLRTVIGLDANSAGKVLGKRAGAVRTAAYRGLQALAECDVFGGANAEEVR